MPPDMKTIAVKADRIRHPILKPIKIDLGDGLSPDEAAVMAVVANPTLRAERDMAGFARAQLLQAGLLPNPQLSLGMDIPSGGDTTDTVTGYGFGIGWDLRTLITRGAGIDRAQSKLASVNLQVAWKEWQVAEAAKLHLYRLLYLKQLEILAEKAEGLAEEDLRDIKDAVDSGEKTVDDLMDMEQRVKESATALIEIQKEIEKERLLLNRSIGLPPGQKLSIQENIKNPFLCRMPPSDELLEGIYKRRPDIIALKEAYRAEDAELRRAVLSQFPNIGIGMGYSRGTDRLITIGPSITIDLPFLDHAQGRIAIQKATTKETFDQYTARIFEARSDVVEIISDMGFIKRKLHILQRLIPSMKTQCQTYKKSLTEGMTDKMRYYTVCSQLLSEQMRQIRLKQLLTDMGVGLEIVSGRYFQSGDCDTIDNR